MTILPSGGVRLILLALLLGAAAAADGPPASVRGDRDPIYRLAIDGQVLHANTLDLGPIGVRDVVCKPVYAKDSLTFTDCQASGYGGRLTGDLQIDLAGDDSVFHGRFAIVDMELGTILKSFGHRGDNIAGTVNGWVEFSMPADHPDQLVGQGDVSIARATLVQLPILTRMLFGDPGAAKGQDQFDARFELRGSRVRLLWGKMATPSATLALRGSIGFEGDLDIDIATDLKVWWKGKSIPGWRELVGGVIGSFFDRLARFRLRGLITNPELVLNPFGNTAGL